MIDVFIVIFAFIIFGMIIGLIIFPKYQLHGPNASETIAKSYKSGSKCYGLDIDVVPCNRDNLVKHIISKL